MIPKQLKKEELKFCRIKKGSKAPFEKNWTNKPYSWKEIQNFLPQENYGVLCGYGNLAVVDCDEEALQLAIENLLPETFKVKTGGGGTHNYFFIPKLKQKIVLTIDNKHLGEVQSVGSQVVAPNSIHPNGKKYEIDNDKEIAIIKCEQLLAIIKPFMKELKESEENANYERKQHSEIDDLNVTDIWGLSGLKKRGSEYFGSHPIHGSDGGMNFWINSLKNTWHCFRCNSGGGVLSAIAVKNKIIDCSEAHRGTLRGSKALECINIARGKYGLEEEAALIEEKKEEIEIVWDKDLQNYQEDEQEWIIDRLIPNRSICVLAGKRGTLKTFIALLIGYNIASGTNFLGKYLTQQGGVIYLDKENGIPIMKKRTAMLKNGLKIDGKDLKIGFICFSQLKIDKDKDIKNIEKLIEKVKPKLLIIDTYRRGISFDENDAGAVSELFVDILRPLVEKYNLSIILIHHNRKGTGEAVDEMDEIRGSSDLTNYADIILKMERPRKAEGCLVLKQLKNRNTREENPIRIKSEFNEEENYVKLIYEGEYLKQTQTDKCVEILSIWIAEKNIKEFKTKDAKEIAFKAGIKETNFKGGLMQLQDLGVIKNIGFGLYQII